MPYFEFMYVVTQNSNQGHHALENAAANDLGHNTLITKFRKIYNKYVIAHL